MSATADGGGWGEAWLRGREVLPSQATAQQQFQW